MRKSSYLLVPKSPDKVDKEASAFIDENVAPGLGPGIWHAGGPASRVARDRTPHPEKLSFGIPEVYGTFVDGLSHPMGAPKQRVYPRFSGISRQSTGIARRFGAFIFVLVMSMAAYSAEDNLDLAFRQALRDMGSDLRLMCLAAHPDDEDAATLAKYRKQFGIETYAVIATRGEGGQNEVGRELCNELGVLRTFEQMAAAEVTNARASFLNLADFGYSKTREETFKKWGREETVRRLVRAIREIRPDVIITHHNAEDGHGHHQALGDAVLEAFDAAADAGAFPELIEQGLEPWQVKRLYVRAWEKPENADAVEVDVNQVDPVAGISYAEIAARALEQHRSQGMQPFIDQLRSGQTKVWYVPVKKAPKEDKPGAVSSPEGATLFTGIHDRVTQEDRAFAQMAGTREEFKPRLLPTLSSMDSSSPLGERRLRRASKAAALAMGVTVEIRLTDAELIPGQEGRVEAVVTDAGEPDCESVECALNTLAWTTTQVYTPVKADFFDGKATAALSFSVPRDQPVTVPYADHVFDEGFLKPQLEVMVRVMNGWETLTIREPVQFDIAPPATIDFPGEPFVAFADQDPVVPFKMRVVNHTPGAYKATVILSPSSAFKGLREWDKRTVLVEFSKEGEEQVIDLPLELQGGIGEREVFVTAMLEGFDYAFHGQGQILKAVVPEGVNVGVITNYDTVVIDTLERLRVPHAAISQGEITPERLKSFNVVLVDIRAYHAREDLVANNQVLLDYVKQGGTAIVMYQKTFEWKPEYAPYPIHVSRNRVTLEDAPIEVLEPEHPLFNTPNTIVPEDWLSWVQERGLYFPDKWDERYIPLIRTHDPGEDIPSGSCLICDYGEGTYLYTALVWYRQLREAHPGALRVFANMLALGK